MKEDKTHITKIGSRLQQLRELEGIKYRWQVLCPFEKPSNENEQRIKTNCERKVQRIENGEVKPDVEYLLFWINKGYSSDYILTGHGNPKLEDNIKDKYKVVLGSIEERIDRMKISTAEKRYLLTELSRLESTIRDSSEEIRTLQRALIEALGKLSS